MRQRNTTFGLLSNFIREKIIIVRWKLSLLSVVFLFLGTAVGSYIILSGLIQTIFASDTSDTWNFAVAGDYTVSDDTLIEVVGNTARLKVRNYISDANTAALYHFDEASGGTASDSSSNANHATVTTATFASGSLNNGLTFNNTNSYVAAPDTNATSLTGSFTIETWTKFSSGFSATTSRNRQGILDKGTYQLYYDNETGKVNFEMAPSSANDWAQVAGPDLLNTNGVSVNLELNKSWDANSKNFVWNQVVVGSDIYVALGSATSGTTVTGDAEVWKCTACSTAPVWSKIGGDGVNSSWPDGTYEDASSIVSDGTNIYVGLGNTPGGEGEVWRWNGTIWSEIGGDGLNSSWTTAGGYERVTTMVVSGTTVYAGLGLSAGDAEIWKCASCNGGSPTWSKIGGDGSGVSPQSWATSTYEDVSALTIANSTVLVVGLGTSAGDAEVWTCDNIATCTVTTGWTKRGGDATGVSPQSWTASYDEVRSLGANGTVVYAGLGVTAGEAEVWRCDNITTCTPTTGWTKVGGSGVNASWAVTTYERVWSLLVSGTTVYAGLGDSAGDAEVWKCTSCDGGSPTWTKLGGDGTGVSPQSWGNQTGASFLYASSLSMIGNYLFVGASSGAGTSGAEVWRCDTSGTCSDTLGWTRVAGNYLNKSWGTFNLNSVESMVTIGGKLYAGTGYNTGAATANGNAQVWEYGGTNWTMIGGQGINSSWAYGHPSVSTVTYRSITSMTGYNGTLVVGLGGGTNGDAEVWSWNGTAWTKIGGDATGSGGQSWAVGTKQSVPSMMTVGTKLYVGLQGTAAGDGELWSCDLAATCTTTAGWTFVGGDATGAGGQSWNNTMFESVWSMTSRGTNIYMGLGSSAADAEVWTCDIGATCTQTAGWTKLGGDGVNSSWALAGNYEEVSALAWYRGELYAGLGNSTGDAELWKWNGTTWSGTAVAGDGLNGSWIDATYERVKSIASYNGDLMVAVGDNVAGEGEVWKYDTSTWTKIGGDGVNSGWSNVIERINTLAVYQGKLYAGTGISANQDAMVWSYGNNVRVQSPATSQDTAWHHIAVTYNGSLLKLFIDGSEVASQATTATMLDTVHPLVMGSLAGSQSVGGAQARFVGQLDEVRISNTVRSSFTTTPYTAARVSVQPTAAVHTSGIKSWDTLTSNETLNGGAITYRLSSDAGTTWQYWNGSAWATSTNMTQASTAAAIGANLATFPVTTGGFLWQAVLLGNGNQLVTLNSVLLDATSDLIAPVAPSSIAALDQVAGAISLTTDTWYTYAAPSFTWSGASDAGSGLAGYYVYFGTDNTADPETAGTFQVGSTYTASSLSSGSTYYLRVKAKDNAQNASAIYAAFIYKLDTTGPSNPATVSAVPAVYSSTNDYTFSWIAATDASSGIAGYQYQVGASVNPAGWSATTSSTSVNLPGAAYTSGENLFHLRTLDNAGNISSSVAQVSYYYAGNGPSAPTLLSVDHSTSTTNSFTFDWEPPVTYSSDPPGNPSELTYCYTVNALPTESNCIFTSPGVTGVGPGAFASQVGLNTFYVVAKNGADVGGVVSYGNYASVFFTANTSAPGIATNTESADVSVKNTESWKIAVSWERPADVGSGISEYEIYRSIDNSTFAKIASTSGIAYVDTGLEQKTYYYKVRACDNVHNCGVFGTTVSLYPTGRFTSPAGLSSDPSVSAITTKSATISWSTDRTADTKIQYGKSARSYFGEEPSNSDQVTEHTLSLSNLSPGTKYYYKAKWTDEDGNTGISNEASFSTAPAPTVTDPKVKTVGLTNVILEFTVEAASKARIYYGTSTAFGAVKEISTSTNEATYDVTLDNLEDGTKYYYKVNTLDTEDAEYDGSTLSFETLPRPKISNVRLQQVRGTAQTVMLVTWETNTETSSIVTYYPEGSPADSRDEVNVRLQNGQHKMLVKDLQSQTNYVLIVKGRDKAGNEASSEIQKFTTATDTRPPQVLDVNVEGTVLTKGGGSDQQAEAQIVVSWNTDEAATSQVEYGEGTGSNYAQKTQEDAGLVTNHTVVISGLAPSKVYHLRIISKDKASNTGNSIDIVSITPKATASALDLVVTSLRSVFGN